jgi:hypothetical protein
MQRQSSTESVANRLCTIYARAIGRIHRVYEGIDPNQAKNFQQTQVDQVGLRSVGLFALRWQQFLRRRQAPLVAILLGAFASLLLAAAVLRHQWRTWMRVAKALPLGGDKQ